MPDLRTGQTLRDIVFQCLRRPASFAARGGGLTGRGLFLGFVRALADDQHQSYFAGGPYDPTPPDPVSEAGRDPAGAEVFDIPDWLEAPLRTSLGGDFASVMAAMSDRAPIFLRVNPARGFPARAIEAFGGRGDNRQGLRRSEVGPASD